MAGHSKWAKVKHYKTVLDARRGKIFSKIAKEIAVACKLGGGDPTFNPRLRAVLLKARAVNMPSENIERAIKRGTGELEGLSYEELTYEGFAPGGVGVLVEVLTDNKNRTAAEIRLLFTKHGGHMAPAKHLFHRKGQIVIPREQIGEEELMGLVLDAGAEDMVTHEETYEITTDPHQFEAVHKALEARKLKPISAEVAWVAVTPVPVNDEKTARAVLALVEALEDHDDVQNVYYCADIPSEFMEKAPATV
ncbi:MAG: YebC/PmpR family DNA-binding transcriptional regulator [Verrucomicrobiae bacterium]|nr:YebC/PmpR family DNA-binding transcriptional regulator [Verrucomicrobiae bacterium]